MTPFLEKTIKFLGKSQNPASVEVLLTLLKSHDQRIRTAAFEALFLKKEADIYVTLFRIFAKDEEAWSESKAVTPERLSRLADAACRSTDKAVRNRAAEVILKYKLYETLPIIMIYLEGTDKAQSLKAREMVLQLAESFYEDLKNAPSETDRRNLDRRREWFVQQLDGPIKRYSVHEYDEVVQALLIVTKKDYDTMRTIVEDHRSVACKRIREFLQHGDHPSYVRLLLSYVGDAGAPPVIDEILTTRTDPLFVRKMLEVIGPNPSMDFRDTLKRFKEFAWFSPNNPDLPALVEDLEPNAIQILLAGGFPKDRTVRLYRFFLQRPSFESRRAAAEAMRRLLGEDVNALMLEFVNDRDPVTAATIFRTLKARNVQQVEQYFDVLVERTEEEIRKAIYDTMPELRAESFASRVNQMTPTTAATVGRYVRRVDPNTFKVIADDIVSPIPIRRQAACIVAATTGFANEFEPRILELALDDQETSVRINAISALGTVISKDAVSVLQSLLNDRSMDIRDAATAALKHWMSVYQSQTRTG